MTKEDFKAAGDLGLDFRAEHIKQLEQLIKRRRTSMNKVSKAIGVSQTALSQYINGKYHVSEEKLKEFDVKIGNYLTRENERAKIDKDRYVKLSVSESIQDVLSICYIRHDMGFIYGVPGTGKTVASNEFTKENSEAILITAYLGIREKSILQNISRELELESNGSVNQLLNNINYELRQADRLIIIDEAQFLNLRSLEIVRTIHDLTKCGIVYLAQPYLFRQMMGKASENYAQLSRRVGFKLELGQTAKEDIEMLVKAKGVEDKDVMEYLYRISHEKYGSLGTVCKILDRAIDQANIDNTAVTVSTIDIVRHYTMTG